VPVRLVKNQSRGLAKNTAKLYNAVIAGEYLDGAPVTARDRIAATNAPPIRPRYNE
jgi:hypothetical protein